MCRTALRQPTLVSYSRYKGIVFEDILGVNAERVTFVAFLWKVSFWLSGSTEGLSLRNRGFHADGIQDVVAPERQFLTSGSVCGFCSFVVFGQ